MKLKQKHQFATGIFFLIGATASFGADQFPAKPIRIIVTSVAGGLLDAQTRSAAKKMGDLLGQSVVVENKPGAGGLVAIRYVKAAPPDGYTLLATPNTIAIQQVIAQDPGYDIERDFAGIGPLTRSAHLLVESPDQPDKSLGDFMARAKANPGKLTYASAGIGTATHLGAASFVQRTGLQIEHVPYQGNPAAWPDVVSKRVDMIFEPYGSGAGMIRSGKFKALAVASSKRLEALPDVPTFAEQGVPNFTAYSWFGLIVPAKTPKDVVAKLAGAMRAAMASTELQEKFRTDGSEVMSMSPEEFNKFLKSEVADISKLITQIGLPKQ